MLRTLRCIVGAFALLAVTNSTGSVVYGYLGTLILKPEYALVSLTMTAPPGSCNFAIGPAIGQYKIILSQTSGNALVQQLLHAQTNHLPIWIVGTNSCDRALRETVDFIQVYYEPAALQWH